MQLFGVLFLCFQGQFFFFYFFYCLHEVKNTTSDTIPPYSGLTAINAPGRYFWISCYFFFNDYIEKSLETIHVMIGDAKRGRIVSDNSFFENCENESA